ncbi:GNAT family N-acetyltransferase [Blastochloris viridis]|uniref:Acetyltransferase (GNAT) family protein n=1 Tax=Blastochloris viridis TaxID=1079 RepID=A0A0H5BBL6_BLAVI|nr:GNAT family N-acetyltransferase [Blastochloris viridis]ALK10417.1 Acetyltransferase Pat [Blastochloris viridis]BAR99642.1 GCN5-related N-acetyltransferase [Blastochloris viridis]CUU43079.1 Acetyltransferase (GNAT) family protein [Blastochloris viridis]
MMHEPLVVGGVIRKLWSSEALLYRDHLLRLAADDRRQRFGLEVTDDSIAAHALAAFDTGAVVHGFFIDGVLRGAAELHVLSRTPPVEGELAFSVEAEYRNSGIGSALFGRTLLVARNRGVATVTMNCLPSNRPMQSLAKKFEAKIRYNLADVIGELKTPGPTPISLWREMVADGSGLAASLIDAQMRAMRVD